MPGLLGSIDQRIVVDGRKHLVTLEVSICPKCGAKSVSGKELERAENDIRQIRGGYSGRFVVRISPELHRRLAQLASDRDLSINQLVADLLEKGAA